MRAGGAFIYALFPLLNAEKTACAGGTAQTAAVFRHNETVGETDCFFGVYDLIVCSVMNHQVHNKSLVKSVCVSAARIGNRLRAGYKLRR